MPVPPLPESSGLSHRLRALSALLEELGVDRPLARRSAVSLYSRRWDIIEPISDEDMELVRSMGMRLLTPFSASVEQLWNDEGSAA